MHVISVALSPIHIRPWSISSGDPQSMLSVNLFFWNRFFSLQRLAEIAHSLLKMVPTDASMLQCQALLQFIQEVMPIIDWSQDAVRPALHLLLRRLDRTFSKLSKKPMFRSSGGGSLRMHGTRTQASDWSIALLMLWWLFIVLTSVEVELLSDGDVRWAPTKGESAMYCSQIV